MEFYILFGIDALRGDAALSISSFSMTPTFYFWPYAPDPQFGPNLDGLYELKFEVGLLFRLKFCLYAPY